MEKAARVIILSGFLGSGKTTVLMQLITHLRAKHGDSYRIAIIENEIGSASVDASVIRDAGYSVTEMLSGCVCCTLIGELVPAIRRMREDLAPDLIILEATGIATPETIRNSISKYAGLPVRVITLVDAARWEKIRVALEMLLKGQLEPADVICVNKIDLVDESQIEEVEQSVREMNAEAPIVLMSAATPANPVDLDLLMGE